MRRIGVALAIALLALLGNTWTPPRPAVAASDIVVTLAADGGATACPGATCTLRKAIETANADLGTGPLTIGFDSAAFPPDAPATISIGSSPLPPLRRSQLAVDASGADVRLLGTSQNLSALSDGLMVAASDVTVRGIAMEHFNGACIRIAGSGATVGGDSSATQGNRLGNCGVGIDVQAPGATIGGNLIGFAGDGSAAPLETGIQVAAANTRIGDDGQGPGYGNVIGNAQVGIRVGTGGGAAFAGTRIAHNSVGRDQAAAPAPVTRGIELRQPSTGTLVSGAAIAYATTGISVAADVGGVSVTGNRFVQNTFQVLTGLAVDLNADGIANPNDEGDADGGANGLLNHPTFARAVQSRISGSVGSTCGGCSVQIFLADHRAGSPNDYGSVPVAGGTVVADSDGVFALDTPAVTPGQWITALATDAQGNTSEFGPSTRVGGGVAQCGNVSLVQGWNHLGFFGAETALGDIFPSDGAELGAVTAIYHLRAGTDEFEHWFAGDSGDRTLTALEPAGAYWFFAQQPLTLSAGFTLSVPLPVTLTPGWNDVVYIGAAADVRDALASVAGQYSNVFRWLADGEWATYGALDTPPWAREFTDLETCATYELFVTAPGVLTPLQP
jgi:hypothetical protein